MSPDNRSYLAFIALILLMIVTVSAEAPAAEAQGAEKEGVSQVQEDAAPVVTPPRPLYAKVRYPEGEVVAAEVFVNLTIDSLGRVSSCTVEKDVAPFSLVVERAAKDWVFTPAVRDGVRVASRIPFTVTFAAPSAGGAAESTTSDRASEPASDVPAVALSESTPAMEVVISGEAPRSSYALTAEDVRTIPGAFGDAFRAIEVMPSVVPFMSGLPFFYVRGAPPGNTGYFFDGVQVPVLYHLLVGPAVIHPRFVDSVDVLAGPLPARWGPLTGGAVVGGLREPGGEVHAEAALRLVDAGGVAETPFADGKGAFAVGGRYSYTGWLLSMIVPDIEIGYWDYQSYVSYDVTPRDTVRVLWFGAGDALKQRPNSVADMTDEPVPLESKIDLSFHRADLRWVHYLDAGRTELGATLGWDKVSLDNRAITASSPSLALRNTNQLELTEALRWQGGATLTGQRIRQHVREGYFDPPVAPNRICGFDPITGEEVCQEQPPTIQPPNIGDEDYELAFGNRVDMQVSLFSEFPWKLTSRLTLTPGLRADYFTSGAQTEWSVDPRLHARFELTPSLWAIHGLGTAHQRPSLPIPFPAAGPTLKGGLQRAVQHSAGLEWAASQNMQVLGTLYQHLFSNFTDAGAIPDEDLHNVRTDGHARGFELMLRRRMADNWSGLLSYNLSQSRRYGERYSGPSSTDRTHVLNAAINRRFATHYLAGVRALFYTGVPATYSERKFAGPRTTPFWRIDWRIERNWPLQNGGSLRLVAEVVNTTLNEEIVSAQCSSHGPCDEFPEGPVTIPNIGLEGTW